MNIVSYILFWMKDFGLTENDQLNDIANYIFDEMTQVFTMRQQ